MFQTDKLLSNFSLGLWGKEKSLVINFFSLKICERKVYNEKELARLKTETNKEKKKGQEPGMMRNDVRWTMGPILTAF